MFLKNFSLPHESLSPRPNGNYLNTHAQNSNPLAQSPNDFSWVHPLSLKISESLINSPTLPSPFTSSTLQNLMESSLHSLLSVTKLNITPYELFYIYFFSMSRIYNSSPYLNLLQWNVRSLPARITSLQNLLAHHSAESSFTNSLSFFFLIKPIGPHFPIMFKKASFHYKSRYPQLFLILPL